MARRDEASWVLRIEAERGGEANERSTGAFSVVPLGEKSVAAQKCSRAAFLQDVNCEARPLTMTLRAERTQHGVRPHGGSASAHHFAEDVDLMN